jgi:nucleoside phosphorylase
LDAVIEADPQVVVIVTALDVEAKAVLRHLGDGWTDEQVQGTVYYRGKFEGWDVVVVEAGPGNPSTAVLASSAISRYQPAIALFVGVGGGIKDVRLGDVVVASKVYGYESGKDTAAGFRERPDLQRSAHPLEQRARAMCKRNEWRQRLDPNIDHDNPDLMVGPVAAGEKVVASQRSATAKFLKRHYSDAIAVEMEGRGFLEAAHINSVIGTVIRGISDLLSKKAAADSAGGQKRAADAASAVAFELLTKLGSAKPPVKPEHKGKSKRPAKRTSKKHPGSRAMVSKQATKPDLPAPLALLETQPTLNEAAFFERGEVLARVGVPDVDEVLFSFDELPDGFVRVIPKVAKAKPIANATLLEAARDAPLLKHRQYGAFTALNARGVFAYDPGGPHRGGSAPLAWGTQLFPNGELWLASNTVVVRERGGRPQWVPIPFIPAFVAEDTFHTKTHAAVAFAVGQLGLTFPCDVQLGVLGLKNVRLAIRDDNFRGPIHSEKVIHRHTLATGDRAEIDTALLEFFNRLHDATGHARPSGLFHFPPDPPHP